MTHTLFLKNEAATEALAARAAALVQAGDVLRLVGELGAGKSTFARAFIRAMGTASTHIPSPTYTLMQLYDDTRLPVAHLDCYRLDDPAELDYMGLEDLRQSGIIIAEWPPEELHHQRADAGTLTLALTPEGDARHVTLTGTGTWEDRLPALEVLAP